jgi:DNA-binding XRE family transcriptional regulator
MRWRTRHAQTRVSEPIVTMPTVSIEATQAVREVLEKEGEPMTTEEVAAMDHGADPWGCRPGHRGLSQEAVARKADISLITLARIEGSPDSPARSSPAWATFSQIAAALGLSLEELGRLVEAQRAEEAGS